MYINGSQHTYHMVCSIFMDTLEETYEPQDTPTPPLNTRSKENGAFDKIL